MISVMGYKRIDHPSFDFNVGLYLDRKEKPSDSLCLFKVKVLKNDLPKCDFNNSTFIHLTFYLYGTI